MDTGTYFFCVIWLALAFAALTISDSYAPILPFTKPSAKRGKFNLLWAILIYGLASFGIPLIGPYISSGENFSISVATLFGLQAWQNFTMAGICSVLGREQYVILIKKSYVTSPTSRFTSIVAFKWFILTTIAWSIPSNADPKSLPLVGIGMGIAIYAILSALSDIRMRHLCKNEVTDAQGKSVTSA